jgi:hypothetical protein
VTRSDFGFYFEHAGLAATQGAIAPAEQYFEGSRAEVSVVRETGQNSLDAVNGDGPVRMEFELGEMQVDSIPGVQGLREHLAQVEVATRGSQGHGRMKTALKLAHEETVWILRISDFGTTGLEGSESLNTPTSPLSALTRGAGISANDGSRGGSFGIGSAVGPMASAMCTVFYTSLPRRESEVVFAGHSRLATHQDSGGIFRVGDGFFTDVSRPKDFSYLRNPPPFGPFKPRTQPGTDIFIVGYRKADEDPQLHNIRDAFIDNFMMAVHEERLEVSGRGLGEEWHLDALTLEAFARTRPESLAFYRAIHDREPTVTKIPLLGEVALHINVDPELPKTLHTITMRRPLMRIDTFRHTSIPAKYAAVLVCADPKGNAFLRELEPPQHDCWDGGRAPGGHPAIKDLKDFVRQALRERVRDTVGEIVEIKGLARFLPSDAFTAQAEDEVARPGLGDGSLKESATVQGDPDSSSEPKPQPRKNVHVPVQRPARNGGAGGDPVTKGRNADGSGKRGSGDGDTPESARGDLPRAGGGDLLGSGEPGQGRSRISAGQVRFRSWSAPSTVHGRTTLQVALTAAENLEGDIELMTLGAGGAPEPDYELPILSAHMVVEGARENVAWKGNVLKDVKLAEGRTARLEIELEAGHRYRLEVK